MSPIGNLFSQHTLAVWTVAHGTGLSNINSIAYMRQIKKISLVLMVLNSFNYIKYLLY